MLLQTGSRQDGNRLHHILGQKKNWDAFFVEAEHDSESSPSKAILLPLCRLASV
jgi:hypothetical protein